MDDVCELEGICGEEMTQILDLGSDVKNNEMIKESLKGLHPPTENISNQEGFSVNLEKLNFEIHEGENVRDGENKILFQNKQALLARSETDPESNTDEPVEVITSPEGTANSKHLFNGNIAVDATDVEDRDEKLNEAINKALKKHLDVEEDYEGLSNRGDIDNKEASVQTAVHQTLFSNESCRICRLQQVELKSDLTALCLEYPPYKKIKIKKWDSLSVSTSETRFLRVIEDSADDRETEQMRRRKVSSDDQIVPQCPSEVELKNAEQNPESSTRSIRIGLSKRAKLRPLHQIPKLQATDTTENNISTEKFKI